MTAKLEGRPIGGVVLSVVLSSHVIADLERVADYLIVLSRGQVQVAER
jgi:ABC-type Na+ transport system ATPase subunit NatA